VDLPVQDISSEWDPTTQAYLGAVVGWFQTTAIKGIRGIFWFPSAYKSCGYATM